jgi:predicted nucleotidyltransferase
LKYGLSDKSWQAIFQVLRQSPAVERAVLFGSRAKGNFNPGSDIDIAVSGRHFTFQDFLLLKVRLDELDLLNKIDPVSYDSIKNPDFKDHIDRVGIMIYQKLQSIL